MKGSLKRLNSDLEALREAQGVTNEQLAKALHDGYEDDEHLKPIAVFGMAVFIRVAGDAARNRVPLMLSF
jgi:hypothetical protein